MSTTPQSPLLHQLTSLRDELVDLAWTLDQRGQLAAADVAMTTSARIAELCLGFASTGGIGGMAASAGKVIDCRAEPAPINALANATPHLRP